MNARTARRTCGAPGASQAGDAEACVIPIPHAATAMDRLAVPNRI